MENGARVDRLGPNFRVEPGVLFKLPIGATHVGLNGGTICAAKTVCSGNLKSNERRYLEIPAGSQFILFPDARQKKSCFEYGEAEWIREEVEGYPIISLATENKTCKIAKPLFLYKRAYGRI